MALSGRQSLCAACGLDNSPLARRCQRCGLDLAPPPPVVADPPADAARPRASLVKPGASTAPVQSAPPAARTPLVKPGPVAAPPSAPDPPAHIVKPGPALPPPKVGSPASDPRISLAKPAPPGGRFRTIVLPVDAGTFRRSFGRTPDNDVVLSHPQVSSHHALLTGGPAGLTLEDLGSHNGTFVRGHRIAVGARVPVSPGERVYIGPWPVVLAGPGAAPSAAPSPQSPWVGQPLYEVEAWGLSLRVPDRDRPSTDKTLLDDVSFKALPGDMIALMGPSGAGKTTLLMVLNGYLPPSAGQVRVNGEDLYAIYDNLRGVIGYVPQDDIVHPELTVFEAVRYSARFRLPPDTSDEEIDRRVEATLTELGLIALRNLEIGKPEKKVLSGGQRKRVNIAMELVTDPVILFLDEPTSGLAADDTTALIRSLSELTRRAGKTVIMTIHQPAKDEFELFNLVLLMGPGGIPIFFGPTSPDSYAFFGELARQSGAGPIANPRDLFDVLAQREKRVHQELLSHDPGTPIAVAKERSARLWRREFYDANNPIHARMYGGERALGQPPSARGAWPTPPSTRGQLGLLVSRYMTVKRRDVVGTAIMLLQAPIIGGLLALVFHLAKRPEPAWCGPPASAGAAAVETGADHSAAIFFLVVAAVWFGTSNAAREVVSERAIYLRERMVNLRLGSYVASKYLVLSLFCVVQCTILLAIVSAVLGFHGGAGTFLAELAILVATSMNAVALGLLLSTAVSTTEAAMALTPIALIPQVVLGGFVVHMSDSRPLAALMSLMPARWGFQGVLTLERGAIGDCARRAVTSDAPFLGMGLSDVPPAAPPAVLAGMTVLMLLVLVALLKRRDPI